MTDTPASDLDVAEDRAQSEQSFDGRIERWMWTLGGVLAAAVVMMVVVRAATSGWLAAGDFAVMRMRSLDVGTTSTPLVGVYSRYGWNHPGPMMFYAYAPFLRLVGGASYGLLLGALAVNLASFAAVLWLARRAGAFVFATFAAVLSVIVFAFGAEELFDPWNPYVIIAPLVAAAVAAWRCLMADRVAAIVLVIAASFAIQTHVGASPMALMMLGVGVVGIVRASWWGIDDEAQHRARRTGLIAIGVLLACWIPPLLQQLFPGSMPGNLRAIVSFFLDGSEPTVGLGGALRMTSRLLTLPPHLDVGWSMFPGGTARIPWLGMVLVGTTVWSVRRGWRTVASLHLVAWLAIVAFVIGAARVAGVAYPYLFRWGWVAVVLVWAAIILALVAASVERWPACTRWSSIVLGGITAVALTGTLAMGVDMTALDGWSDEMRAHEALVQPTLDAVREVGGPTELITTDQMVDGTVANQLLFEAGEQGIDLRAGWDQAYIFGRHRTIEGESARHVLIVAPRSREAELLATPGSSVVVADADVVIVLR